MMSSSQDNISDTRSDRYNMRRKYRSVAFGTWQVGAAREMAIKRGGSEGQGQLFRLLNRNQDSRINASNQCHALKPAKFGISFNCNLNTVASTKVDGVTRRMDNETGSGFRSMNVSDCDLGSRNGKTLTECYDQVLNRSNGSLSGLKRDRIVTSVQRVHQRSRSVGTDNHLSVRLSPCKENLSSMPSKRYSIHSGSTGTNGGGFLNPFKATKKFLKKMYDTATLPNRFHSKVLTSSSVTIQSEFPTTSIIIPEHLSLDGSYSVELPDDETSYQHQNVTNHQCDSMPSIMKTVTVIDDTMNDSGLSRSISSSGSQRTSSGDFRSWDEVFNHLKREMAYMRQRDAQIFADLHFVERQLRNVKNQAMAGTEREISNNSINIDISNDNNETFDKRRIKLGELVESMPL